MPGRLRTWLFWAHLLSGVVVALAIVPVAVTGVLLSFEHQILHSLEADARVTDPGAAPLGPTELVRRSGLAQPERLELRPERTAPAVLQTKAGTWLLDPYDGHVIRAATARARFGVVERLHRSVGLDFFGQWELGTTLAGIAAVCIFIVGVTGPFLWWPRRVSRAQLRRRAWFSASKSAQERDFHWHHVIGIWCAPVLIAASATGVLLCFDGARDAVTMVLGKAPAAEAAVDADAAVLAARRLAPDSTQVRVRWQKGATNVRVVRDTGTRPTQWASVVKAGDGLVLRGYEDGRAGEKALGWARWLHTGQALGIFGQALWATAVLGVLVLAWTGVALALRRWRRARRTAIGT